MDNTRKKNATIYYGMIMAILIAILGITLIVFPGKSIAFSTLLYGISVMLIIGSILAAVGTIIVWVTVQETSMHSETV